ncbi:hypothetical protein V1523DRAFT_356216 [Lipomyces doorenjongii]
MTICGTSSCESETSALDEAQNQTDGALARQISTETDATLRRATTSGLTTGAADNALQYDKENGTRLMIAVHVGVSQT